MAYRRDDLVVVEHRDEQTPELRRRGQVLHRPVTSRHEHAFEISRGDVLQRRRSGEHVTETIQRGA
jgi:hypothetical protein